MSEFKGVYIGLKDKKGNKIKCGDKIKTEQGVGTVIYDAPSFNVELDGNESYNNGDYYNGSDPCCHAWGGFEVVYE